jgi:predicted extracellular nuclease
MRFYLPFSLILSLFSSFLFAQPSDSTENPEQKAKVKADEAVLKLGIKNFDDRPRDGRGVRVTFYNVENLFDIEIDPDPNKILQDDFTPRGNKGWTAYRYKQKLSNIYKTMSAVGGWGGPPELIGFCELENRKVLKDLIRVTPLNKFRYKIVHEDSPDRRGIDVGFIYRSDKFEVIEHEAIKVVFPFDSTSRTRDVLHVTGKVLGKDTLHIFVNHWPSRRGGQAASEPKRVYVAGLVRQKIDEIYAKDPDANIIVMGDFNDEAEDKSLMEALGTEPEMDQLEDQGLYNYMHALSKNWKLGSHKYQGHWGTLDHMVVSAPLIKNRREGRLHADKKGAQIFAARFLLEEDKRYMGLQPFRTYAGPRFLGGFSDHLPIYIDLIYKD